MTPMPSLLLICSTDRARCLLRRCLQQRPRRRAPGAARVVTPGRLAWISGLVARVAACPQHKTATAAVRNSPVGAPELRLAAGPKQVHLSHLPQGQRRGPAPGERGGPGASTHRTVSTASVAAGTRRRLPRFVHGCVPIWPHFLDPTLSGQPGSEAGQSRARATRAKRAAPIPDGPVQRPTLSRGVGAVGGR
jgi:hypothetical protein